MSVWTDRILSEIAEAPRSSLHAYLHGATGDATYSRRHGTVRFGQSDPGWLNVLRAALERLSHRSWMYREGASRHFWVLETSARIAFDCDAISFDRDEAVHYVKGFFDAEGGFPTCREARAYVQFAQRARGRIEALRHVLDSIGIDCGVIHNPSAALDPEYWRFYVRARSIGAFIDQVGSWHPRKRPLLEHRRASHAREGTHVR